MTTRPVQKKNFHLPIGFGIGISMVAAAFGQEDSDYKDSDYKAAIGYEQLREELGDNIPKGQTVSVSHVEWMTDGAYAPDVADGEFAGREFEFKGSGKAHTSHATAVGKYFYGRSTSIVPAIPMVEVWPAQVFLESPDGLLRPKSGKQPEVAKRNVQNHSWVYNPKEPGMSQKLLRRFDFMLDRDNVFAVACTRPGENHEVDDLLASSYNAIVAGVSSGRNTSKPTRMDGEGRIKPEIVAPIKEPSAAGPVVAASAALLLDEVHSNPEWDNAGQNAVLKAILLAGATKEEFPEWSRTSNQPLDSTYGAGELNIFNSYKILAAGEQKPGKVNSVTLTGWDWNTPEKSSQLYYFDVDDEGSFSAVLCWNRTVVDGLPGMGQWGDPQSLLVTMALRLYSASGTSVGDMVDSSESIVDNLQHIYRKSLPSGRYALEVTADLRTIHYGLAWQLRVP